MAKVRNGDTFLPAIEKPQGLSDEAGVLRYTPAIGR